MLKVQAAECQDARRAASPVNEITNRHSPRAVYRDETANNDSTLGPLLRAFHKATLTSTIRKGTGRCQQEGVCTV
jgi:hypothetical protein